VQFLVQDLVITCHTTYPKLATEGSWILRYHRSRFFTFLFFMPKLSGNSLDKFNKSCIALHQTSRKVDFAFFRFFYDFLETLQESAIWQYYWRCTFTPGTLQRTKASQSCPWFTEKPSERFGGLQCGPWPWGRRGSANSGEAGGAPGRAGARGGGHAHLGLDCARSLGGRAPDGGARRWPAVTSAAGCGSGEGAHGLGNKRCYGHQGVLGAVPEWLGGSRTTRG
jgi:hypothetical protein